MSGEETHLWVMVSNMDQDAKADEVPTIISRITSLVDDWHSKGRIMLVSVNLVPKFLPFT